MKLKTSLSLIVIFIIMVSFTMTASGQIETQTSSIDRTSDDGFVTEIGALFDSSLVTILDPNMDIRSFLVFRDIKINAWERLENATLRIRSAGDLPIDTSSVTIQGIKNVAAYLPIDAADVLTVPLTSSSVVAVTNNFQGGVWLEIDVTNIVRELMSNVGWVGDGTDGTGTSGKIGFLILGAEGHRTRYFYDYLAANGLQAQIVIFWGDVPPPPSVDAPGGFNDTQVYTWTLEENVTVPFEETGDYNETVDIWRVDAFGPPEFQYLFLDTADNPYYHNSTRGVGGAIQIDTNWNHPTEGGATSPILRVGKWTLILGDPGAVQVFVSDDEFNTNVSYTPNLEYTALDSFGSDIGSIAVDRQIENLIHIVYTSLTPAKFAAYNVVYTNFTIDMTTGIITFAPTFTNITQWGETQNDPVIHVQENGTLHVVWFGQNGTNTDQIWYSRRHTNGTWLEAVRVSETDVIFNPNKYPDVIANRETGDALIVWDYDLAEVRWKVIYPNNTVDVEQFASVGRLPSMVMDRERNAALMVYSSGGGGGATIYFRNKTILNSTGWGGAEQVSPGGEKHFAPDIGVETVNGTIQVLWYNDWNLFVAGNYWAIGSTPLPGKTQISNVQGRRNYIEEEFIRTILNTTYFVYWGNGTIISGPLDSLDDVDEFLEEFFGLDPDDPDPATQGWDTEGPFTRFKTRFYIFFMGVSLLWGPIMFFAWRRPTGYHFIVGILLMTLGLGLMIQAGVV